MKQKKTVADACFFFLVIFCFFSGCVSAKSDSQTSAGKTYFRGLNLISAGHHRSRTDIRLALLKEKPNHRNGYEVREGGVLTQNDRYAVQADGKGTHYIYIFQVDSNNQIFELFPSKEVSRYGNPVSGFFRLRIPDIPNWFQLDGQKGTEKIILMSNTSKIRNPGKLCRMFVNEKIPPTRGIAGVRNKFVVTYNNDEVFIIKKEFLHK